MFVKISWEAPCGIVTGVAVTAPPSPDGGAIGGVVYGRTTSCNVCGKSLPPRPTASMPFAAVVTAAAVEPTVPKIEPNEPNAAVMKVLSSSIAVRRRIVVLLTI
jgi:hypothetical protein